MFVREFKIRCPASSALFAGPNAMSTMMHRHLGPFDGSGASHDHAPAAWRTIVAVRLVGTALEEIAGQRHGANHHGRQLIAEQIVDGMPDLLVLRTDRLVLYVNVPTDIRAELVEAGLADALEVVS